jgi:hypothetical protein
MAAYHSRIRLLNLAINWNYLALILAYTYKVINISLSRAVHAG